MFMKSFFSIVLAILCLSLVPISIGWEISWNYYSQKRQEQVETLKEQMESAIGPIVNLNQDRNFFHAFFSRKMRLIDQSAQPMQKLIRFQKKLASAFPESFEFVVWQKNGELNSEISQIDGYRYIFKTMFKVLKTLKASAERQDKPGDEELIPPQTLTLLRGFFGQFLLEERLQMLFFNDAVGQTATISEAEKRRQFWAYVGANFSVGIFINARILKRRIGPNLLIQSHNHHDDRVKIGYFSPCDFHYFGISMGESERDEILMEAKKFEDFALDFKESGNFLLLFKKASPDFVAFSYVKISEALIDPSKEAGKVVFQVFKWLFLLAFILYSYSLRQKKWGLKIKYRFLLMLLLTNGLPALLLVTVGYSFFSQKRSVMIFDQQQKSLNILREFDLRYLSQNERLAKNLNDMITALNQKFGANPWPKPELEKFERALEEHRPSSYLVIDKDNIDVLEKQFKQRLVKLFLLGTLYSVENNMNEYLKRFGSIASTDTMDGFGRQAFWLVTNNFGNIALQSFGLDHGYSYTNLFGNEDRTSNWALLVVRWGKTEFLENFCKTSLKNFAQEVRPRIVGVVDTSTEQIFSTGSGFPKNLIEICKAAKLKKIITKSSFIVGGKRYLLAATSSVNSLDGVFFCLYPMDLVAEEIFSQKLRVIVFFTIILFLFFQIGLLFSGRIMNPINHLQKGLSRISENKFDCELSYQGNDELGRLVKLFNSAIRSLKEFSLGTAIQESLFPGEEIASGKVRLFAKSLFMSKMGGDYFDFFEVEKNRLVVFFGDVAGHGMPAAVLMAMVKASILHSLESYESPSHLLHKTRRIFDFLKSKKYRRMMTCCCFEINTETGEFVFSNAGQCYPLIVSADSQEIKELRQIGFPLGAASNRAYEELYGKLEVGESIVFYSDGLVEGRDANDQILDFDGFQKIVKESWSGDLKEKWTQIISRYNHFCEVQNDDLTILMIEYNG